MAEAKAGLSRYFTHGDFAGISAFSNKPGTEADRNANFLAVGVLVSLSYGRLGRSWMHAQALRELSAYVANKLVGSAAHVCDRGCRVSSDEDGQPDLEKYWHSHRLSNASEQVRNAPLAEPSSPLALRPEDSKSNKRRSRALSDAAGFPARSQLLSPDHPALSMPEFLDTFGPLVFPLYRAALLRKRVLFLGSPPIQRSCNFGKANSLQSYERI